VRVNRLAFVQGYVWHVFPTNTLVKNGEHGFIDWTVPGNHKECVLTCYGTNGILLLTENPSEPSAPPGWMALAVNIPEDWTFDQGGWKFKMLHDFGGGQYVFAGIVV